jgi:AcrR family transcriptional regulator
VAYHHGDLRNALITAAADLARSGGPGAVTIRAAARDVGVTPTAAYRHFADQQDLLQEAKYYALTRLSDAMNAELHRRPALDNRVQRALGALGAIARGYLNFALTEPGLFRTAFSQGGQPPALGIPIDDDPFRKLTEALDELLEAGYLPAARRPMAELAAWSLAHGYAMLLLDGPLQTFTPAEREEAYVRGLEIMAAGLGATTLSPDLTKALIGLAS